MIEIGRHLEILLLSNDCVVVPGLGGFVAHHVDARYDAHDGMFLPPLRTLGFNTHLTMNDSLLAQSYAEAYDISFPQAMRCIEEEVSSMKQHLSDYGSYELHGLGELYVNKEGNIGFNPYEAGILTPVFYGFGGFEMMPLPNDKRERMEKTTTQHDKQKKEKKTRIIAITTDSQSGQKMVSVSLKALRQAAVAAIIIMVLFLIASPISNNPKLLSTDKIKSGILLSDLTSTGRHPDKSAITPTVDGLTTATQQKSQEADKTKNTQQLPVEKDQWVIVLCSHVSQKNAERFRNELAKENISARVLKGEKGNVKVVYGNYSSKEKAQEVLTSMRGNKHFQQAWLLQTK